MVKKSWLKKLAGINLEFLGIHLDLDLNMENGPIISKKASPVSVRVMQTNEELMIARHTRDLLTG
jgi:acetate kinase